MKASIRSEHDIVEAISGEDNLGYNLAAAAALVELKTVPDADRQAWMAELLGVVHSDGWGKGRNS